MNNLNQRIAELSPAKRALLGERLRQKAVHEQTSSPILVQEHSKELLSSFAQQRMWFLDQLEGFNATYNRPTHFRLGGVLNVAALHQSLNEIVRRHEVLRSRFINADGQPSLEISDAFSVSLPVTDLSPLPETERAERSHAIIRQDAQQPFDLTRDRLIRAQLLKLSEQAHILLITLHHIVFDGWSAGVLQQEITALYRAFSAGKPSPLALLSLQYTDFSRWQQQQLNESRFQSQLDYWTAQLGGKLPTLALPTDRPRSFQTFAKSATHTHLLPKELIAELKAFSQRQGITLFMTLLAAYKVLLYRYTGQTDVIVGIPVAGRDRIETESLIGIFINTLALRTSLKKEASFESLLNQIRQVSLEAYENQQIPLEKLIEVLQPSRDLSTNPLFQTLFQLRNLSDNNDGSHLQGNSRGSLQIEPIKTERLVTEFDLMLDIEESSDGLICHFCYRTDLFEAETIRRSARHFERLLKGALAEPTCPIARLPLLTEVERHQLLVEWNSTQTHYPQDRCIHKLFEAQVKRTPDAIAVAFNSEQLTYRALNQRANCLAHHLQTLGVKAESPVGICVERSVEMVVGLLGILKAGGAYVPLDLTYPTERLSFMLKDAQVSVVLGQTPLASIWKDHPLQMVELNGEYCDHLQDNNFNNLDSATAAENAAYITYTSGSTGAPKGVAVPHRAVNRLVCNTNYITISPTDVVAQASNIAFDAATFEIWGALLNGARLVGVQKEVLLSPQALSNKLKSEEISILFVTTALFHQIASTSPQLFSTLRCLLFGGETVDAKWVRAVLAAGRPEHLINVYGPTENTTFSSYYEIEEIVPDVHTVPIGYPIANTQLHILDDCLQPVPKGIPGELFIGGDGLAKGYLNRPELTAERFISNPFSQDPEARLYRSGDLARYLLDGSIEYLNRIDSQVKIRGFRVELGEIEAALSSYSKIKNTVVVIREEQSEGKSLVAYLTSHEPRPTSQALHHFLKDKLPDYMIPSAFVCLEKLPLTPNGKVDRRALPMPDFSERTVDGEFVSPQTQTQEKLSDIWSQLLKVKQIGIHDNFFELGGHSLLATQVISRIHHTFSIELSLRALFESPTVSDLAAKIEQQTVDSTTQNEIPSISRVGSLPLSFAQQRLWFLDQLEGQSATYNIPLALQLSGDLNVEALEAAISEIVRRHEALRTTFQMVKGEPVQVISPADPLSVSIVNLQTCSAENRPDELQRLANEVACKPFDLECDSLLRVQLFKLAPASHVLLVVMHHIVSDGWSIGIFSHELSTLYREFSQGKHSSLNTLPIQYVDFAQWQRQYLQGKVLERQLNYWRQQLADTPALSELPTDHPRPAVQSFRGETIRFSLSEQLSHKLKELSQQSSTTLFITLLTAFSVLLYRYSYSEDIVIGSPIANRNRKEIEPLIGFLVNTLPLRTDLSGNPSFSVLLKQVHQTALDAYDHQELPFERLVEELNPERDFSYHPFFQVMFVLQNATSEIIELPGIQVSAFPLKRGLSKFDLTLSVREQSEGLIGAFEYNCDLFNHDTIQRLAGHFQTLLEGIVANPQQPIVEFSLLTEPERHQLLVEWNNTQKDYPSDRCIHQLFEAQVERTPDVIAVVFENEQLTYSALNKRANQLAHYLQTLGVGPDVLVGICVERSLEMIVGLLGILKAGGAYLPLDPEYPSERLAYMIADASVPVLLTQQTLKTVLPSYSERVICLDEDIGAFLNYPDYNARVSITPNDLAYAIYTSGSTGQPKGVLIQHQGLCNLTKAKQKLFQLAEGKRCLQSFSLSFDGSVWEIFPTLTSGATLYLVRKDQLLSGPQIAQWLDQQAINIAMMPPSLLSTLPSLPLPHLSVLAVGGEPCPQSLVTQWSVGGRRFFNAYGPTEATVCTTVSRMEAFDKALTIGRPIDNAQVFILDDELQVLPVGVPGELLIGGVGLARGYLNRPELTAERFISHPFSDRPNARLYKTGDLARYLPDGNIEILGRIDHQVKIRGFRIELGEIEAALCSHAQIQSAVVVACPDTLGSQRLAAYVIVDGSTPTGNIFRSFLKELLPEYMVPSHFVCLDRFPLTSSGKVDRQALPELDLSKRSLNNELVFPRSSSEKQLSHIWAELLKIKQIGIYDNFFELGGHSLLATQVISQIREVFSIDLPLRAVFEAPTVAELSESIEALSWVQQSSCHSVERPEENREEFEF